MGSFDFKQKTFKFGTWHPVFSILVLKLNWRKRCLCWTCGRFFWTWSRTLICQTKPKPYLHVLKNRHSTLKCRHLQHVTPRLHDYVRFSMTWARNYHTGTPKTCSPKLASCFSRPNHFSLATWLWTRVEYTFEGGKDYFWSFWKQQDMQVATLVNVVAASCILRCFVGFFVRVELGEVVL